MVRRYRKRGARKYRGRRKQFGTGYARAGRMAMRGLVPGVHRFKETCMLTNWSCAAGSTQFGVQAYKFRDLFNYSNFTNIFDMYKITGVKLTIIPRFNTASVSESTIGPNINELPLLYVAPNRSPWSVAPTSIQDVLNDDGCKVIRLERKINLFLKNPAPQILDAANTGVPIQTNGLHRLWLTTGGNGQLVDQTNVNHFGHRWAISNLGTNGLNVDVYATYYFKMKEQD